MGKIRTIADQIINKSDSKITEAENKWLIEIEVPRLQPKRSYFSEENIYFYSIKDVSLKLDVSVYADNLSMPLRSELTLKSKVTEKPGDLRTILKMHHEMVQQRHRDDE